MSLPVDPVAEALTELSESYLADGRPWVVAYSGGKDSTLVLQLVYETLIALGDKATKPIYVISFDTGVELSVSRGHMIRANFLSSPTLSATSRRA